MTEVRREELSEIELKDCMRIISDPTQRFTHDQKGIAWDRIISSYRALAARVQAVERERDRALAIKNAQLAEAQGRVLEVGELNVKLRDAAQQVVRLRESLIEYMTLADKICYAEPELTQYRNMKTKASQAIRETGA